nr:2-oxoacid:acceptor oxidoreductase family protein [uncultured Desulfobacter sp.]
MKTFNIYITGVGGQGIGLLSQTLLRAIDYAGIQAIAVDTHGLAQRGGVVVSRIRCGETVHSPLIMKKSANLVLGMEIHEAMRGLVTAGKEGGTLVFLDVSWQPLPVRLGQNKEITSEDILDTCQTTGIIPIKVDLGRLKDSRMQNMALLGTIASKKLIPGTEPHHFFQALEDLLAGRVLTENKRLFTEYMSS